MKGKKKTGDRCNQKGWDSLEAYGLDRETITICTTMHPIPDEQEQNRIRETIEEMLGEQKEKSLPK